MRIGSDEPSERTPAKEAPARWLPLRDLPLAVTPASCAPLSDTPLSETPLSETPLSDTPLRETPFSETPLLAVSVPSLESTTLRVEGSWPVPQAARVARRGRRRVRGEMKRIVVRPLRVGCWQEVEQVPCLRKKALF